MEKFEHSEDVEEWLAPMNYEEFWLAIKHHYLPIPTRESCDGQIARGDASFEDVREGLKILSAYLLRKRHRLQRRPVGPVLRVVSTQD